MLSCALSIIQAPNLTTLKYLKVSKISHTSQTRNPHARPSVGQPSVQSNVRATLTTMPSGLTCCGQDTGIFAIRGVLQSLLWNPSVDFVLVKQRKTGVPSHYTYCSSFRTSCEKCLGVSISVQWEAHLGPAIGCVSFKLLARCCGRQHRGDRVKMPQQGMLCQKWPTCMPLL